MTFKSINVIGNGTIQHATYHFLLMACPWNLGYGTLTLWIYAQPVCPWNL